MDRDESIVDELARAYEEYRTLRQPSATVEYPEDVDVDIATEGAYIAGLVERLLSTPAQFPAREIVIDSSIEERLRHLSREGRASELIAYRQRQLRLAALLSRASAVPIRSG